jgi:ribosomal protein S27AE
MTQTQNIAEKDDVERELIAMAEEGLILAKCPSCGMILGQDEVQRLTCGSCGVSFEFSDIIFLRTDTIPQG